MVANDPDLASTLAAIAYPGLTANFDIARVAALAVSLADWIDEGADYGAAMVANARALAEAMEGQGLTVHRPGGEHSTSHQLALEVSEPGGARAAALRLEQARLLVSDIGLPNVVGEGVRLGTPEVTRLGFDADAMADLGHLVARALHHDPTDVAPAVTTPRRRHGTLRFVPSAG